MYSAPVFVVSCAPTSVGRCFPYIALYTLLVVPQSRFHHHDVVGFPPLEQAMAFLTKIRDSVGRIADRLSFQRKPEDVTDGESEVTQAKPYKAEVTASSTGATLGLFSGESAASHAKEDGADLIRKQRIDETLADLAATQPWSDSFPHEQFARLLFFPRHRDLIDFWEHQQRKYYNRMRELDTRICTNSRMSIDRGALLHRVLQMSRSWTMTKDDEAVAPQDEPRQESREAILTHCLRFQSCDVNRVAPAALNAAPLADLLQLVRGSQYDRLATAAATTGLSPALAKAFTSSSQFVTRPVSILELILEMVLFYNISFLRNFAPLLTRPDLDPTGAWPWLKQWLFAPPDTMTADHAKRLVARHAALTEAYNALSLLWTTVKPRRDLVICELSKRQIPKTIIAIVVVDYLGWSDECVVLPPLIVETKSGRSVQSTRTETTTDPADDNGDAGDDTNADPHRRSQRRRRRR